LSSESKAIQEILETFEDNGRCFVRACKWNKEEGCEKPDDKPCPLLWWLTGNLKAGVGLKLKRKWKNK